jgi:hypothetical protein
MRFNYFFVFFKIFLLPDRCDKSKRRTKTLANTGDPRWGQTFIYTGLRRADLNNRLLEVEHTAALFVERFYNSLVYFSDYYMGLCSIWCQ